MSEERFYFLSTGRCATNFLYKFFSENYPEMGISHQKKWSRLLNIISNMPCPVKIRTFIINFIFKVLRKESIPNSTVDPLISHAIMLGYGNIENAKFIHVVRDPLSFAKSFTNWAKYGVKKKILHGAIPYWMPKPKLVDRLKLKWRKYSHLEKFFWVWKYKNLQFRKLKDNGRYLLIRVEDFTNPKKIEPTMDKLLKFMEIEYKELPLDKLASQKVNQSKKITSDNTLNDRESLSFQIHCRELMHELGY